MCRSTDNLGFYQNERDRLKISAFYLRLPMISNSDKPIPESITLMYPPRISGSPLEINGSKIRPDLVAFVTLHRVRSAEKESRNIDRVREAFFASRERVRASEGVRFEVYVKEEKVLKGIFRKDEVEEWKLECKCALESESIGFGISEAEVCIVGEGHVGINEKVKMVVRRRKCRGFEGLDEIPEEREVDVESDDCDCDCCCCGVGDGGDFLEEKMGRDMEKEIEMEGVRWAVDVGIWVMCLGVGYLVSKASSKSLRKRRISFL